MKNVVPEQPGVQIKPSFTFCIMRLNSAGSTDTAGTLRTIWKIIQYAWLMYTSQQHVYQLSASNILPDSSNNQLSSSVSSHLPTINLATLLSLHYKCKWANEQLISSATFDIWEWLSARKCKVHPTHAAIFSLVILDLTSYIKFFSTDSIQWALLVPRFSFSADHKTTSRWLMLFFTCFEASETHITSGRCVQEFCRAWIIFWPCAY